MFVGSFIFDDMLFQKKWLILEIYVRECVPGDVTQCMLREHCIDVHMRKEEEFIKKILLLLLYHPPPFNNINITKLYI
jgi:hypothetical protein